MIKYLMGFLFAGANIGILAAEIRVCSRPVDCNDGEICVSYTGCNKKQMMQCIPRTCYRSGAGCPGSIVCHNKHCADLSCKPK